MQALKTFCTEMLFTAALTCILSIQLIDTINLKETTVNRYTIRNKRDMDSFLNTAIIVNIQQ